MKKKTSTKWTAYEPGVVYESRQAVPPSIDFTADPDVVRVMVEGERLTYGGTCLIQLLQPKFR